MKRFFVCGLLAGLLFPFVQLALFGPVILPIVVSQTGIVVDVMVGLATGFGFILASVLERRKNNTINKNHFIRLVGAGLTGLIFAAISFALGFMLGKADVISLDWVFLVGTPVVFTSWIALMAGLYFTDNPKHKPSRRS